MHTKAQLPLSYLSGNPALPALLETFYEYYHLKQLYRQGWLKHGIPAERCESVAEHAFSVAVLSLLLADAYFPGLDGGKVVRMSLLHDFGEIYTGDLTPDEVSDPREKHRSEEESILKVLGKLPHGEEYIQTWQEFEACATPEARFVRQMDALEMGIQASIYEHQGADQMSPFLDYVATALKLPELQALFAEIQKIRPNWYEKPLNTI